jgi:hypothetical protein
LLPGAEGTEELKRELRDFHYAYTSSSRPRMTFDAKSGAHDDRVIALALACWGAFNLCEVA